MSATIRLPQRLDEHDFLVLVCARDTKDLTLVLPDQQSFDLGSYWNAEERAIPYLHGALNMGRQGRSLAESAVSTAMNFGAAYIDMDRRLVSSVLPHDPQRDEAKALEKMFAARPDLLDRDDRADWPLTYVEPARGAS